ncbi:NAD(P)-dependent oxidoreductase [Oryzifoliimicrobium ureilyticus]|uniref:NAD(P)-dependent oxidoreductase n=1 Tax=Oryzifoliimicrobium ureilyticus TaxID=3113724 RepID=UPI00307642F0
MDITFIGLGRMGLAMAENLLKAGHRVTVYNRSPKKAETLAAQGAVVAPTPAAAVDHAEIVVTMLADDKALDGICFGPEGIITRLPKGTLHVSCSTISVTMADRLSAAHADAGHDFVSAPVFGRPEAAAAGNLFIVAAGARAALEKAQTVFSAIGQKSFIVSEEPRAANLVKLSGNFLIASVIESLGEAMALVEKGGIDKKAYLEILTSTLFNAPVYKTYGGLIADQKFDPAGFAAPLGQKDVRLTLEAGELLGVPLPIASLLRDRFLRLIAQGGENLDWSAIGALPAKDAGLK